MTPPSDEKNPTGMPEKAEPNPELVEKGLVTDEDIDQIVESLFRGMKQTAEEIPVVVEENIVRVQQKEGSIPVDTERATQATSQFKAGVENARVSALDKIQKLENADPENLKDPFADVYGAHRSMIDPTKPKDPADEIETPVVFEEIPKITEEDLKDPILFAPKILKSVSIRIDQLLNGGISLPHEERKELSNDLIYASRELEKANNTPEFSEISRMIYDAAREIRLGGPGEEEGDAKNKLFERLARAKIVLDENYELLQSKAPTAQTENPAGVEQHTPESISVEQPVVEPEPTLPQQESVEPVKELINKVDSLMTDITTRIDQQLKGEKPFTHDERIDMSDALLTQALDLTYKSKDPGFVSLKDSLFMMARDIRKGALNEKNLGARDELNRRLTRVQSVLTLHHNFVKERVKQIENLKNIVNTPDTNATLEAIAQAARGEDPAEVPPAPAEQPAPALAQDPEASQSEQKKYEPYIPLHHRDKELFYASYGRNPDGTPFEDEPTPEPVEEAPQSFNDYLKKWNRFVRQSEVFKDIPELSNTEFDQSVFDSLFSGNRNVRPTSRITSLQFENYIYRLAGAKRLLGANKAIIDAAINEFESGIQEAPYVPTKPQTAAPVEPLQPAPVQPEPVVPPSPPQAEPVAPTPAPEPAAPEPVVEAPPELEVVPEPVTEPNLPKFGREFNQRDSEPDFPLLTDTEKIEAQEILPETTAKLVGRLDELARQFSFRDGNKLDELIPKEALEKMLVDIKSLSNIDFKSPNVFKSLDQSLQELIKGVDTVATNEYTDSSKEDLRSLDALGRVMLNIKDRVIGFMRNLTDTGLPDAGFTYINVQSLYNALAKADERLLQRYKKAKSNSKTPR